MPTVPVLDTNQIAPSPIAGQPRRAADFGAAGVEIGNAVARLGQSGSQAVDAEDRINTIYDDAGTKRLVQQFSGATRDTLYGQGGYFSQQGIAALNAKDDTVKALSSARDDLIGQATSPRMKRMVTDSIGALYNNNVDAITKHATTQGIQWGVAESQGLQQNRANDAVTHADDPALFSANVGAMLHEIDAQAGLQGTPPALVEAQKAKALSSVHVGVSDAMARADPVGAAAWVQAHAGEMLPDDVTRLKDGLYQPLLHRSAVAWVDAHTQTDSGQPFTPLPHETAPMPGGPSLVAKMLPITAVSESGGRDRNSNGSLVTSSAGAQGRMQVMPGTNGDPGYGVKPAQDSSDAERARVGQDYLGAMLKHYGGDPAKAWAAYNAGPGRVDSAVASGGGNWLRSMPAETQSYVQKNVRMLGGPSNAQPTIDARDLDPQTLYAAVDKDQSLTFDQKEAARQEIATRVSRNDSMISRQQSDAKDDAYQAIAGLGPGKFTSTDQIPRSTWRVLSPEMQVSLQNQAASNAAPTAVKADGDTSIGLSRMAVLDPHAFATTDLRNYRTQMTPGEFAGLVQLQTKAIANPDAPEVVSHSKIWSTIDRYAPDVGLNLGTKDGQPKDKAARDQSVTIFNGMRSDLNAITQGKRAPTDDEVQASWDRQIMNVKVTTPGRIWGSTTDQVPRFKVPAGQGYNVDVPNDAVARIRQSFAKRNITPSQATIVQTYIANKGKPGFWN